VGILLDSGHLRKGIIRITCDQGQKKGFSADGPSCGQPWDQQDHPWTATRLVGLGGGLEESMFHLHFVPWPCRGGGQGRMILGEQK